MSFKNCQEGRCLLIKQETSTGCNGAVCGGHRLKRHINGYNDFFKNGHLTLLFVTIKNLPLTEKRLKIITATLTHVVSVNH